MGRLSGAWSFGTLPPGSATLLTPVVAAVGEEEAERRLATYCDRTEPRFASVRDFVAKHAAFADHEGELVKDGWFTTLGDRATLGAG
jgi:hypothetical protein